MRRFFTILIGFCIVSAGFFGGFSFDILQTAGQNPRSAALRLQHVPSKVAMVLRPASANAAEESLSPVKAYAEVLRTIKTDYYGPTPSTTKLTYTAIRGMIRALNDPYTTFWNPEEFARQMEDTRGDFGGIGATLEMTKAKKVLIVEPIENSPAERAGIRAGDVILAVDGKPVQGLNINSVVSRIRGKEGTRVRLTLQRKDQMFEKTITRAMVHSPIIKARMQDEEAKIGYIALEQFNEQADEKFDQALRRLESTGMRSLIFDLRSNPGGLLNVAQDVASRFVHAGKVVIVQERNGSRSSLDVNKKKHRSPLERGAYPVVVLVNGGSASASEIVAGAIKDHNVGTLVGTTTFGKGLVQTIIPLGDNSAVKITTQRYFTPNGTDINKKLDANGKQISGGITPDYVVERTEKDIAAERDAVLAGLSDREAAAKFDAQINKATELLKNGTAARLSSRRTTQR